MSPPLDKVAGIRAIVWIMTRCTARIDVADKDAEIGAYYTCEHSNHHEGPHTITVAATIEPSIHHIMHVSSDGKRWCNGIGDTMITIQWDDPPCLP